MGDVSCSSFSLALVEQFASFNRRQSAQCFDFSSGVTFPVSSHVASVAHVVEDAPTRQGRRPTYAACATPSPIADTHVSNPRTLFTACSLVVGIRVSSTTMAGVAIFRYVSTARRRTKSCAFLTPWSATLQRDNSSVKTVHESSTARRGAFVFEVAAQMVDFGKYSRFLLTTRDRL